MKIFVGLGNPGAKYAGHRHNIGYMAVDRIASDFNFPAWRNKFGGQISLGKVGDFRTMLLKPETYMNRSGQSVSEALHFYKLKAGDAVVFHDEIDLVPGKVRIKKGGGHAGHNGLRSIEQHVGSEFARVRMGVGHPGKKELVHHYVLSNFLRSDEESWLDSVLRAVSSSSELLHSDDIGRFSNSVSRDIHRKRQTQLERQGVERDKVSMSRTSVDRQEGWFAKLADALRK